MRLILSFLVGGSYVAFTLWVSERFGSRIGGLLGGLPSTILVSLVFIAWNQGNEAVITALSIAPAVLAACTFFLIAFVNLHKYGRSLATGGGLLLWFCTSFILVTIGPRNIFISTAIAVVFLGAAIVFLRRFPDGKVFKASLTKGEFFFRVVFAGTIIALAVLASKLLGPLWGGMMAGFPAGFLPSMFILERKHGIRFAASVAKNMPYGNIAMIFFLLTLFFLIPVAGMVWATLVAYLASLLCAFLINRYFLAKY
ncbi:MAG: DUF3147 family protein [Candidatus Liptonbacteria bacterium]|nr:DUF3147 family protein [Candidatus Liptonbacteria bacterium]